MQSNFDKHFKYFKRKYDRYQLQEIECFISSNPKEFWNKLNKLGPKKTFNIPMEVVDKDGNILRGNSDVLACWKLAFEGLFKLDLDNNFDVLFLEICRYFVMQNEKEMNSPFYNTPDMFMNRAISIDEVQRQITQAKSGKACGPDSIPYEATKNENTILLFHKLINLVFDTGCLPELWTKAIIFPIPKSSQADPKVPLNYRGIILLCNFAKLYSGILNKRLLSYLEVNNKLVDEQNGFRPDRSCLDHVFSLTTIIKNSIYRKRDVFALFIDFKKAFDLINRELLMAKMKLIGITGKLYFAIKSMLTSTQSCVKINNQFSDYFSVDNGVRQGDPISATLFAIYINDLIIEINEFKLGIDFGDHNIAALLYADDLVLFRHSESKLQKLINIVYKWTLRWRIIINKDKSKIMHFRKKLKSPTEFKFQLGSDELKLVKSYKYLGITLDYCLNFNENLDILASSAQRALGSIINKYKNYRSMGFQTYTKLYDSCVKPIIDYCSPVWSHTDSNKTELVQHRAIRAFMGVHRYAPLDGLYGDMGWLPSNYRRKLEVFRYWNRLVKIENHRITKQIFLFDYQQQSKYTWSSYIKSLFIEINMVNFYNSFMTCNINTVKNLLIQKHIQNWKSRILSKPKLRFYNIFKNIPMTENYVSMNLSSIERSYLAQLRLGILPLEIETGRYKSIPIDNRKCKLCNLNLVEDEKHILFTCTLYNDIRLDWKNKLTWYMSDFETLSENEKLNVIFICPRITAKYIIKLIDTRKEKIYNEL